MSREHPFSQQKRSMAVAVAPPLNRVVRYKIDAVGNDLSAILRWCDVHCEPVWEYNDGSFECPHDRITQVRSDDHALGVGPWEARPPESDDE